MDNIINFDRLPYYYTDVFIGSGYNGTCYRIGKNKVFKLLKMPYIYERRVKRLSNYNISSFVFPKELVYVKDEFVGYLMDFIDGESLEQVGDILLTNYLEQVKVFENDTINLSNNYIYTVDLKEENILYTNNNTIKAIDTDLYIQIKELNSLPLDNMHNTSLALLSPMMDVFDITFDDEVLDYHKDLLIDGKYLPSIFLNEVLSEFKDKLNYEVNNTTDIKKSLKLILK